MTKAKHARRYPDDPMMGLPVGCRVALLEGMLRATLAALYQQSELTEQLRKRLDQAGLP